jgi:cytochrome c-type biogenesis protein CcmH
MMRGLAALVTIIVLAAQAIASPGPDERLEDERMEARARALYTQLRCVVCQSQSIDDSGAPLAADMRAVVRERLLAGDSDSEVLAYLQARYGDYVLMMPPLQSNTLALWLLPAVVLLGGGAAMVVYVASQKRRVTEPEDADADSRSAGALSDEEGLS